MVDQPTRTIELVRRAQGGDRRSPLVIDGLKAWEEFKAFIDSQFTDTDLTQLLEIKRDGTTAVLIRR